ncbi:MULTISPECIES: alpha/beta hydrolase [Alphaproteobacteria]|uniref:alpha/beta hydrolase n=1 Tax=Alphaproteobacteria TaxID=28211 RepID=UPI003A93E658
MLANIFKRLRIGAIAIQPVLTALPLAIVQSFALAEEVAAPQGSLQSRSDIEEVGRHSFEHLSADSNIGDLLSHPALASFGLQIMPWENRSYDNGLALYDFGQLLPYHSNVLAQDVTGGLNRMIDDIAKGQQVFFDFYSDAQMRADPSLGHTGLFFFRGKPGAPFAVIAPGGGFSYVGSVHEGFPYALAINKAGLNAFVLKYRTGRGQNTATQDLAAALGFVFDHADTLGVSRYGYSLWGSSAGARMAAAIGSHGADAFGGEKLPKPSTVVMAYTAHSDHASKEPATFVVVGENDHISPPSAMEDRIRALEELGTDVSYHLYPNIGHGFGLGTGTSAENWVSNAVTFWEQNMHF